MSDNNKMSAGMFTPERPLTTNGSTDNMVRARADILPPRCFSPRAACEIVAGARASRAQFRADRRRRRRNVISRVFSNLNVLVPVFTTFAGVASVVPVPALRERAISYHALARAPRAGGLGRASRGAVVVPAALARADVLQLPVRVQEVRARSRFSRHRARATRPDPGTRSRLARFSLPSHASRSLPSRFAS